MTLEKKRFAGTITHGEKSFPVAFEAWSAQDLHLQIEVEPLPVRTLLELTGAMGEPGGYEEWLKLEGEGPEGETFFSDTVGIRRAHFGTEDSRVAVSATRARISIKMETRAPKPRMRLWLRGFQSFHAPLVTTKLGHLQVSGSSKKVAKDEASGSITLQATDDSDLADWFSRTDDFLTFLHRGLGFAHGGRLQTPRLDILDGDRWEATYYAGNGFVRSLSPIPHLNQGPFIEALARRYEREPPVPDMLWTAIGWLHSDVLSDEGRFLMSMTALETVVEHLIPKTLTTIIPKPTFSSVRGKLLEALADCGLDETSAAIFAGKIKGLNGRSLSQKVVALRDHYGLSAQEFSDDEVVAAIQARNGIVHTGQTTGRKEIWPKVVFVRELITRIVFGELGYTGPFEAYHGGYRMIASAAADVDVADNDADDATPLGPGIANDMEKDRGGEDEAVGAIEHAAMSLDNMVPGLDAAVLLDRGGDEPTEGNRGEDANFDRREGP